MNKNLMLVTMLSVGTALTTLGKVKPVAASLTPPSTYNYSYTWNATASEQYLNANGVDSIPLYTRTADGVYWNYTTIFNVIDDLSVTMIFNRSNTTWQASGTSWKPDQNKIGSDNTVGSIIEKIYLSFDNNTLHDYYFYLDMSSNGPFVQFRVLETYKGITYPVGGWNEYNEFPITGSIFAKYLIRANTIVEFYTWATSDAKYFDAWYLNDLGISQAWQEGYDANRQGILTDYLGTDAQQIGWVLLGIAAILFVFKGGK